MLEILFPKVRRKILTLLLMNPYRGFHLRELIRALDCGKGAVERELASLTGAGILQLSYKGNLTIYTANRSSPVFPELHGLVLKTDGLADVIRCSLQEVPCIQLALIFGSVASGRMDKCSDIDVLIVGDVSFADISAALLHAQEQIGREIAPTVYSVHEFRSRLEESHHFITRVLSSPKIMLIGGEHELKRLGKPTS